MNRTTNCLRTGLLATVLLAGAVLPALADSAVLGVGCRPENRVLSDKLKERYNVDGGALVDNVLPNSPADQADIRVGDIIVSFEGRRIADWDALAQAIMATHPGAEVVVAFVRAE
jgi:S1-C subfamily serine protease